MNKELKNYAYIDNTNLYKGCEAEGFKIDYIKFRKYLTERLGVKTAYIFIGFVAGNEEMYTRFQEWGYTLVFKPTIPGENGQIKGNCDAELVLQATCDFFEKRCERAVIVTSDGDFACLVKFLMRNSALKIILSPRGKEKCSGLLTKLGSSLTFLPEVRNLIKF
ncbi:MAG: NYN domain-containing protein [bacterium]|nr:NYN domain-containing protein [bacterium]